MKKLFILYIMMFIIVAGCSNIGGISSDNSTTGNDSTTGSNNEQIVSLENPIVYGNNTVTYDKTKQLHTLVYFAGDKYGNYTNKESYTISSNNTATQAYNYSYNKQAAEELSPKEQFYERIRNFQLYAENAGLKPIEKKDDVLYKTAPQVVEDGTKWNNVYVQDFDNNQFKTINATCIAVSNHAYFFLEDGLTKPSDDKIQAIKEAFDKDYEIMHQYYGEETDTDGNGKVSFMIYDFSKIYYGFFYPADKYKSTEIPAGEKSNESDILYVNYNYFTDEEWDNRSTDVKATFIHEFQHMVLFASRSRAGLSPNIAVWINEGLSMLSEYYGEYGAPHFNYIAGYFRQNQGKSLITNDVYLDYGLSYLFIRYLQIRFGDDIVKKIYASNKDGTQMIEEVTGMDFDELFLDFTKMILVTGRGITTDKRYNIDEFNGVQGSEIYNRNGFNLSELIDEVYSINLSNPLFITNTGNTKELSLYGFQITRWSSPVDTINFTGTNGVNGFYYAW